jgi:hypothetical protein
VKILNTFDTKDLSPIKSAQPLFSVTMARHLAYITATFCGISQFMTRLDTVDIKKTNWPGGNSYKRD